jgi:hypothetical protein
VRRRLLAPLAFTAFVAVFVYRVWREARRSGRSLSELDTTLEAVAADAYERMPPEMRAEVDAEHEASD